MVDFIDFMLVIDAFVQEKIKKKVDSTSKAVHIFTTRGKLFHSLVVDQVLRIDSYCMSIRDSGCYQDFGTKRFV